MQWRWPLQREKTEEADGGISGKKGSDLPVFLRGSILAFHSDLGRRSFWVGKCTEQTEAWMRQIFEVQTWRQVSGLAGAVVCETRDLGIKWPQWHIFLCDGQVQVDMRYA